MAEAVIQEQVEAYNARDIDRFCRLFDPNIKTFSFPSTLLLSGLATFREFYATNRFIHPNLYCVILHRATIGNKVIDHEVITMGDQKMELVAIYEVQNSLITQVTFIRQ